MHAVPVIEAKPIYPTSPQTIAGRLVDYYKAGGHWDNLMEKTINPGVQHFRSLIERVGPSTGTRLAEMSTQHQSYSHDIETPDDKIHGRRSLVIAAMVTDLKEPDVLAYMQTNLDEFRITFDRALLEDWADAQWRADALADKPEEARGWQELADQLNMQRGTLIYQEKSSPQPPAAHQ